MMSPPSPAPGTPARHASRDRLAEPVSATTMSLDRCGLAFGPGMRSCRTAGTHTEDRQYSIASGEAEQRRCRSSAG
ncbi:MAG: hypothetical protein U1G05_04820 [Kiritimatiellia bacterium]